MPRFSLRTLIVVMLLGGPALAVLCENDFVLLKLLIFVGIPAGAAAATVVLAFFLVMWLVQAALEMFKL
jgi:hypothetical protein